MGTRWIVEDKRLLNDLVQLTHFKHAGMQLYETSMQLFKLCRVTGALEVPQRYAKLSA